MDNTFFGNLNIIANSTLWFSQTFGINTPEFSEALTGITIIKIHEFYKNKGVDFDMETMALDTDAMLYVYDHVMSIANLAHIAASLGMTPEDFKR